jgi:hypothetical protein
VPAIVQENEEVTINPNGYFHRFKFYGYGNRRGCICARMHLDKVERRCWNLAGEALKEIPNFRVYPLSYIDKPLLQDHNVNFPFLAHSINVPSQKHSSFYYTKTSGSNFLNGFLFAGLFYGSLHLSSWKSHYRSPLEKWLWIASALIIAVSGIASLPLLFAFDSWIVVFEARCEMLLELWFG